MKKRYTLIPVVVAPLLMASSCGEDPCKDIPRLETTTQAVQLIEANDRYELEYAVSEDVDCELQTDGTWERESD